MYYLKYIYFFSNNPSIFFAEELFAEDNLFTD